MKCEKIEKWISDHMDGRLREEKEKSLERHLKKCPSCKAYARNLERIQEEAKILASQEVSSSYKQEFTSRLKAKISALPPELRKAAPLARRWKWAWAGVSFILVIAVGIFLYFNFAQIKSPQETYVFSFEDIINLEADMIQMLIRNINPVIFSQVLKSMKEDFQQSCLV